MSAESLKQIQKSIRGVCTTHTVAVNGGSATGLREDSVPTANYGKATATASGQIAFAFTRDQVYFTNYRILVKDKLGMFGSSVAWKTIPYSSIQAFFIETAGAFSMDVKLGIWPSGWCKGQFSKDSGMRSPP